MIMQSQTVNFMHPIKFIKCLNLQTNDGLNESSTDSNALAELCHCVSFKEVT